MVQPGVDGAATAMVCSFCNGLGLLVSVAFAGRFVRQNKFIVLLAILSPYLFMKSFEKKDSRVPHLLVVLFSRMRYWRLVILSSWYSEYITVRALPTGTVQYLCSCTVHRCGL